MTNSHHRKPQSFGRLGMWLRPLMTVAFFLGLLGLGLLSLEWSVSTAAAQGPDTLSTRAAAETAGEAAPAADLATSAGESPVGCAPCPACPACAKVEPAKSTAEELVAERSLETGHSQAASHEAPTDDTTKWELALGGSANTGNTKSYQANGGSRFELVRDIHKVVADVTFTYGRAVAKDANTGRVTGSDYTTNSANFLGLARYDIFLSKMDSLFQSNVFRRDRFAGLDFRYQFQLGYMRNLYKRTDHRVWAETGYDLTHDDQFPNPLIGTDGNLLANINNQHSVRGFLGYDNQLHKYAGFRTGLEALFDVQNGDNIRVNNITALRSTIAGNFKLELKFTLLFDNVPVSGSVKTDTITLANLIYTLI